jgi:hypothetical protein
MLTSTPVPQCLAQTTVPHPSRQMHPSKRSDESNTLQHGGLQTCAKSEDMLYSVTLDSNTNLDLLNKKRVKKLMQCTLVCFFPS